MEDKACRLLLIEDNPDDIFLLQESLREVKDASFQLESVTRLAEGLARLAEGDIDAVLLDLSLPDSHGIDTIIQVSAAAPHLPIIVMTGLDDEELGAVAVREGAQDYLVKGQVAGQLLARTIRYSIHRKQAEERMAEHTAKLEAANSELEYAHDQLMVEFNERSP